jgi:hypothetical protein
VSDIYLMGAKPVGEYEAERVDNTIKDLQIDRWVCGGGARGGQGNASCHAPDVGEWFAGQLPMLACLFS